MLLADFVKLQVSRGGDLPKFGRSAVDEFSAEFNRGRRTLFSMREDASADAITRFKHDDVTAGAREFTCGCETGGAGADDENVFIHEQTVTGLIVFGVRRQSEAATALRMAWGFFRLGVLAWGSSSRKRRPVAKPRKGQKSNRTPSRTCRGRIVRVVTRN